MDAGVAGGSTDRLAGLAAMQDEPSDKDERDRRRALALRENLKRRKAQQRARTDQESAAETSDEAAKP